MKILYSPQTNITDSVIRKASRIFDTFEYVKEWAWQIANCSDLFLTNFPPNSTQVNQTRQLIDYLLSGTTSLPSGAVDQLLQNISINTATLEAAQRSLNDSAPGNLWEVVTEIRDVAEGIYDMLDRFDWNVFYPLDSEGDYL